MQIDYSYFTREEAPPHAKIDIPFGKSGYGSVTIEMFHHVGIH